jgi:hypothetical protein
VRTKINKRTVNSEHHSPSCQKHNLTGVVERDVVRTGTKDLDMTQALKVEELNVVGALQLTEVSAVAVTVVGIGIASRGIK